MVTQQEIDQLQQIVKDTLSMMGFSYSDVSIIRKDDRVIAMIQTENAKPLIGIQGANLHALHTVIRQIVTNHLGQELSFTLDVNSYREHQREALIRKAHTIAERARSFQSSIEMEPMSSYERFIIHNTLSDMKDIETHSEGYGKERRVVIRFSESRS